MSENTTSIVPPDVEDIEIDLDASAPDAMVEALNAKMDKDAIYTPKGDFKTNAMRPDKIWRVVPIDTNTEMTFRSARLGKHGQFIFEFAPIDPAYAQIDIDEKNIELLLGLEPAAVEALGYQYQQAVDVNESPIGRPKVQTTTIEWRVAKRMFAQDLKRRKREAAEAKQEKRAEMNKELARKDERWGAW
jgi:hypothetical protein